MIPHFLDHVMYILQADLMDRLLKHIEEQQQPGAEEDGGGGSGEDGPPVAAAEKMVSSLLYSAIPSGSLALECCLYTSSFSLCHQPDDIVLDCAFFHVTLQRTACSR